jgi:hypothetical protein
MLSRCECARRKDGIRGRNVEPEVIEIPSRIAAIFDRHVICRIVLGIRESHEPENPIAVGASGIISDGDGEQFT